MWTCLVDVRCLQDPPFRDRGIGRHSRALLAHARPMLPGAQLVGLVDDDMPGLAHDVRAMLDATVSNAYSGQLTRPTAFVELSPMTHDPLFVARLLHHPSIPSAAVVYDFIPLEDPARYLATPGPRLDYHVALRWLARYDRLLPISEDAAAGIHRLLTVGPDKVHVTGAPLAPAFERLEAGNPRHVLVVGGGDPRKNPECAIRAHAVTAQLQQHRMPVVVTGQYGADWLAEQQAIVAELGGDPSLVHAPGHVDEAELLGLYRDAWCVVSPSRAEGFSLPVIEAMAARVPVLASDIAAHRELLRAGLFGTDDCAALSRLLGQLHEPAERQAALDRQATVWPRFRETEVARRAWTAVAQLAPGCSPAIIAGRPRVALLTPLPPDRSGVADYGAPMCEALAARTELHVFTPTDAPVRPRGAASVGPISALPFLSSDFDRVVAVLGNSVFHLDILRLVLRFGGAVILHDGRLLDLYAGHMTMERTRGMARTELGRTVPLAELQSWLSGSLGGAPLLLGDVARSAEPLMMHSRAAVAEVARRYKTEAIHLPFALQRTFAPADLDPARRRLARQRLGVEPDAVVLASFGYVHQAKAPLDCIWSLEFLRAWGVPARLHFVGAPLMPTEPLVALIDSLGLGPHVHLSDAFVDEQAYRDHLFSADVAIQLRPGGIGAVSGALSDCIAAGLRAVASETLAVALDAPSFVAAVPDNPSPVLIAEAVMSLLEGPSPETARRAYVAAHGFDTYCDRLCAALAIP